ncbi:MAG: endonuclease domain-containing protein [Candidatus Pacebacteria bacterium]|nr:endonuclease domain-containing protein [Candidatus Paceibacterota bacterium]
MEPIHNIKTLYDRRRELRNASTPEEILLWTRLKNSQAGFKFRRQHSIGGYIADFYCPTKKLVIEIDGPEHFTKESIEYDSVRSKFFEGLNIKVLRFTNSEVSSDTEKVVTKIKNRLASIN